MLVDQLYSFEASRMYRMGDVYRPAQAVSLKSQCEDNCVLVASVDWKS